jgi:hypothetical protein
MNVHTSNAEAEFKYPVKIKPDPFYVVESIGWENGFLCYRRGKESSRWTREEAFEFAYYIIEKVWEPLGLTFRILNPDTGDHDFAYFCADDGEHLNVRSIEIWTYSQAGFRPPVIK